MVAAATVPGIHQAGNHSSRPSATTVTAGALYFCSTHALIYQSDGTTWSTVLTPPGVSGSSATIQFLIDGAGSALTTGLKGFLEVPFACTITAVRLLADVSGSVVVNIWKDTYANYPPTVADKITASAPPTISGATKSQDTTLTGWTTAIAAGDILAFNVDSATTITRVTVSLTVTR
jgi:hypothetical protein